MTRGGDSHNIDNDNTVATMVATTYGISLSKILRDYAGVEEMLREQNSWSDKLAIYKMNTKNKLNVISNIPPYPFAYVSKS